VKREINAGKEEEYGEENQIGDFAKLGFFKLEKFYSDFFYKL